MTVKELRKILRKCPKNSEVFISCNNENIELGTEQTPIFIDILDRVCLYYDNDEKRILKEYLEKRIKI